MKTVRTLVPFFLKSLSFILQTLKSRRLLHDHGRRFKCYDNCTCRRLSCNHCSILCRYGQKDKSDTSVQLCCKCSDAMKRTDKQRIPLGVNGSVRFLLWATFLLLTAGHHGRRRYILGKHTNTTPLVIKRAVERPAYCGTTIKQPTLLKNLNRALGSNSVTLQSIYMACVIRPQKVFEL